MKEYNPKQLKRNLVLCYGLVCVLCCGAVFNYLYRSIQEVKTMKKIRNIFSKKNLKTIAKLPALLGAIIVVEKILEKCYTFLESSECDLWA